MKLQNSYWYILAQLLFDENQLPYEISLSHLEVIFKSPLRKLFGEVASALPLKILKFDKDTKSVVVKVPKENYVQARAALTLLSAMTIGDKDIPVVVSVVSASPQLLSLCSPFNKIRKIDGL